MLAPMYLTPIGDLADVKPVLEKMGERPHAKANTAALAAIAAAIDLGPDTSPVELYNQSAHGGELEIKAEDGADRLCLLGHDFKFLVEAAIAERNGSADPEALAFRGRDFVTHPLANHLTLELGKGEQHIEGEPAHAGSCVERLGDRHEGHPVLVKQLDQLGEIGERAGQAIDLIDHHDGDLAGSDIGKEVLQGLAVERGAGEAAVVVVIGDEPPAFMRLALDVGFAGLPLGIERVEFDLMK